MEQQQTPDVVQTCRRHEGSGLTRRAQQEPLRTAEHLMVHWQGTAFADVLRTTLRAWGLMLAEGPAVPGTDDLLVPESIPHLRRAA